MPCITIQGEIPPNIPAYVNYQCYNVLDSCITAQLLPVLLADLNDNTTTTYLREMRVLALCLELSLKGFPTDHMAVASFVYRLQQDVALITKRLNLFAEAVGFRTPFKPGTNSRDIPDLFYRYFNLPEIWKFDRKTNKRVLATDIKALEKLRTQYPIARPFVNAIMAYREAQKMLSVFKKGLEPETGNLRCNYSPSGTETGRLSSQQNPYNRGTNGQNITDRVRQVISAPAGYALVNLDLKTAESIAVGYISGDRVYIEACESSDLHTYVCKLVWPDLPWTGDPKKDKAIAEQAFYRHFTYRDQAKRGGHGSNYYGQPAGIAKIINVPVEFVADFQEKYFARFPGIPAWHIETIARVQRDGVIVTPLGRERRFWGRPDDQGTWREAIAYGPQGLVADVMNEGYFQVMSWIKANMDKGTFEINKKLRADGRSQIHDAAVFLVPIEALDEVAPVLQQKLLFPVDFGELGTMKIPSDLMVGKRFCKKPKGGKWASHPIMSQGLLDWQPGDAIHWEDK